jgi:hypothetical protein
MVTIALPIIEKIPNLTIIKKNEHKYNYLNVIKSKLLLFELFQF